MYSETELAALQTELSKYLDVPPDQWPIEIRRAERRIDYERRYNALEFRLTEKNYPAALKALPYTRALMDGIFRKDGITPAHVHLLRVVFCLFDRAEDLKKAGIDVDKLLAKALLHDVPEDKADDPTYTREVLSKIFDGAISEKDAAEIAEDSFRMSKMRDGRKLSAEEYYEDLLQKPELLVLKLYDRRDNIRTLLELVPEKQVNYIQETLLLLTYSFRLHVLRPDLDPVTRSVEREIREPLEMALRFASLTKKGIGQKIADTYDDAALLDRPLPRRVDIRFLKPTGAT